MKSTLVILAAAALLSLAPQVASAETVELTYEQKIADAPAEAVSVTLKVQDAREAEHGGDNPARLGTAHGNMYMPYALRNKGDPLADLMDGWARDVLHAGGFSTQSEGKHPQVTLLIDSFWFVTYHDVELSVSVRLAVTAPGQAEPIWISTAFTATAEVGPRGVGKRKAAKHQEAFDLVLADLEATLRGTVLKSQEFRQALGGKAVTCANDTDCLGNLICRDGRCAE